MQEAKALTDHTYRIVLTGGPCAGKTSSLAMISGMYSFSLVYKSVN